MSVCIKNDMNKKVICLILFCLCLSVVRGQKASYGLFENITLSTEASVTNCFLQDEQGLIWIGSDKGLFSYDGYSTHFHPSSEGSGNPWIYCAQAIDSTYLYLGTDNGMLVYNYHTDRYEAPPVKFPGDIRSLAAQGDTLWIGT